MSSHKINSNEIQSWGTFHYVFVRELSFPEYYGRNMDAWIDCMSDLELEDSVVSILIENVKSLKLREADIYVALIECAAFVNYRFTSEGGQPLAALSYHE